VGQVQTAGTIRSCYRPQVTLPCVFCGIVKSEVPASVVYEDAATLAFMDLRQTNQGHVLVVPKVHFETIDLLPSTVAAAVMATVVTMTRAVKQAICPDGVNVWQSNGEAAGQEVPHVHMHVFPRWTGDGHFRIYPDRAANMPRAGLEELALTLRSAVH
jgi:histidine triad (HIT) family protein